MRGPRLTGESACAAERAVLPAGGGGNCGVGGGSWVVTPTPAPFGDFDPDPHPGSDPPPGHTRMARHVFLTGPPGNPARVCASGRPRGGRERRPGWGRSGALGKGLQPVASNIPHVSSRLGGLKPACPFPGNVTVSPSDK